VTTSRVLAADEGLIWFASVLEAIDQSNAHSHKTAVLKACFREGIQQARQEDLAWLVYFLAGGKLPKRLRSALLRQAAMQASGLSEWLFEACYAHAGDLAETIAHCVGNASTQAVAPDASKRKTSEALRSGLSLHQWITEGFLAIADAQPDIQSAWLIDQWQRHDHASRFAINKIITGGFRIGVSRASVLKALAAACDLDPQLLAQRFMGWMLELPSAARFTSLILDSGADGSDERPLPFCLAQSMDDDWQAMGDSRSWQLEWKWDGIRVQWIAGHQRSYLWSRGEELISEQFPDLGLEHFHGLIPVGTIIDAELLAWDEQAQRIAGFADLQVRLNRKTLGAAFLRSHPVRLMAYDLLRLGSTDLRHEPLRDRREKLHSLLQATSSAFLISPGFSLLRWSDLQPLRQQARDARAEGLMLKHAESPYIAGRSRTYTANAGRSGWWKYKLDPFTVDAALIYAQAGHGRRANLYTDYTFAVRGPQGWLSLAKAYSGLSDAEIREVDARIRKTTVEQFGPVRVVEPTMVFEIAFESIAPSKRHKAGLALRFPRMLRWRKDKTVEEADSIDKLHELLSILNR